MIKNIIFIIMLGLSINQSLYSMERTDQEESINLDRFIVQAKGYNLLFRKVNISSLDDNDRNKFLQLFKNEAERSNFFKFTIGSPFTLNAGTALSFYVGHYEKILENKGQESVIHWVIEDCGNNHAFVGRVCLHTYVNKHLEEYEEYTGRCLLALNITIDIPYRNKKLFTSLAQSTLNKLMSHKNFANATFCFEVNSHDPVMKKAVKKINATKVLSWTMEVRFNDEDDPEKCQTFIWSKDLFIILRKNTYWSEELLMILPQDT